MASRRTAAARGTAPNLIRIEVPVAGMTCRSCEVRIQRFVSRLPSVEKVEASATKGRVIVESRRPVPAAALERALHQAGYEIGHTPWLERNRVVWVEVGISIWIVIALAFLAQMTGLFELAGGLGDISRGGILVALLLGLAAGVSTCAALVGGLVLALSAAYQSARDRNPRAPELGGSMRPALTFVGGRIVGYGAFGALLGALGASVTMPPQVTAVLMITVALVMTLLGTRLTGVSPRMAAWSPTLPMGLARRLGLGEGPMGAYSDRRSALLGALSFFMPCGFTQAIQVYALSTGSPVLGAALLATFAIGTAPGLLGLAGLPAMVSSEAKPTVFRFVGVVVLAFAIINGSAGARLAGIDIPFLDVQTAAAASLPGAVAADGTQALRTTQQAQGYSPRNVQIYAGFATTWTIDSKSASSCASSLVVPSLNISRRLKVGANTINLPPMKAGVLRYSCSMGMYSGTITIVDPPAGFSPSTGSTGATGPRG